MTREHVVLFVLAALTLLLLHISFHQPTLVLEPLNYNKNGSKDGPLLLTPEAPLIPAATDLENRHGSPWGQDRHLLLYCGGIQGRFSNQAKCALKMLWLAATANRTLVMSPIYGTFPTALYDPEAIGAYLRPSGGFLRSNELLPPKCSIVPHVYASRHTPKKGAMMSLGAAECTSSGGCHFAGAQSVVQFDDPRAELADVAAMTITDNACFFLPVPADEFPVMPFHPDIRREAAGVWHDLQTISYDGRSRAANLTLCAHVRREDMAHLQPPLEQVVSEIMERVVSSKGVAKLYVSHNANSTELEFLYRGLPAGTQFGCDVVRWPGCGVKSDGWRRLITEHAICAQADIFIGSPRSSFTGMIAAQRHKVLMKDPAMCELIGQKSDISWPYRTLVHYRINNNSYV